MNEELEMLEEVEVEPIEEEPKTVLFVLNLNEDNRILSACFNNEYIDKSLPRVEELPDGDLYKWLFVNGEYIYSPIVEDENV